MRRAAEERPEHPTQPVAPLRKLISTSPSCKNSEKWGSVVARSLGRSPLQLASNDGIAGTSFALAKVRPPQRKRSRALVLRLCAPVRVSRLFSHFEVEGSTTSQL